MLLSYTNQLIDASTVFGGAWRMNAEGQEMRKSMLLAGCAMVGATLMFGGVANAAPASSAAHVRPNSTWTFAGSGACEVLTISKHHKWTSNRCGDVGIYKGGAKKLTLRWTGGGSEGASFTGKYSKATSGFSGTLSAPGISSYSATVTPGSGCSVAT
jgi:hypothetical protein